ncbi:biotin synthase [Striga asiatica]|uniref:Biotin synthase n=1 Tax=Striga asiatica TaxID=4170 RepID=A0A5A7QFK6_STRAF|nr:biotin synthase [Striga asiatica]
MVSNYSPLTICKALINFISCKIFGSPQPSRDPDITVEFRHADDHSPNVTQKGPEKNEQNQQILVRNSDKAVKRPKKSVTINEKKDGDIVDNREHKEEKSRPPRHWGPLLSVASNINEKCEAFISSRKRAMRRNYTQDPDKDAKRAIQKNRKLLGTVWIIFMRIRGKDKECHSLLKPQIFIS